MRAAILMACSLVLASCGTSTSLITRPPEGYEALRFLQTVQMRGLLGMTWEFPAGSTWVNDRVRENDGARLWCGAYRLGSYAQAGMEQSCMVFDGRVVGVTIASNPVVFTHELPEGSFEMTRLR